MTRSLQIADATLCEVLLRLGYTHVPHAGSAFSKGVYLDGKLVIRADVETVWMWLVLTGQVQPTPTIQGWMAKSAASGQPAAERVSEALERARLKGSSQ